MKMKNNYFLDLHNKWIKTNVYVGGLCGMIYEHREIFKLFEPTDAELNRHYKNGGGYAFWGIDKGEHNQNYPGLRQTIILFCHEILNS